MRPEETRGQCPPTHRPIHWPLPAHASCVPPSHAVQFPSLEPPSMTDISRRDWVKTMGVVSAGALAAPDLSILARTVHAPGDIVDLTSTSEVFIPPRGRSFMKFSFDFPEPSVVFGDYRFGFLVFTDENTYGLDRSKLSAEGNGDALRITCDGFVWAGGQEKAPGQLVATLQTHRLDDRVGHRRRDGPADQDRDDDRARRAARPGVDSGGGGFTDPRDGELLGGYTVRRAAICTARRRRRHDDAAAHDPGVAHRRRSTSRRSTIACDPSASTSRRARRAIASRRSTSTTAGATTGASQCRVAARPRGDGRGSDDAAHGSTSSARFSSRRGRRGPTCPRGCATSRS